MSETIEKKPVKPEKAKKVADPVAATIDPASQQMIRRAQELGVETAFDRAVSLKPCNIGTQGICCKNCGMGPCRLPLPKGASKAKTPARVSAGPPPTPLRRVILSA
jgi:carbon-monoxide dehydrogenase catalytic subunit